MTGGEEARDRMHQKTKAYLLDLAERLFAVPITYGVDPRDQDELNCIAHSGECLEVVYPEDEG